MKILALLEEAKHGFLELSALLIMLRPFVLEPCNSLAANLERFLDICTFKGTNPFDLGWVDEVSRLFAPLTYIASVGLGSRPRELFFLLYGPPEELCALAKGGVDRFARNTMVAEVDESGPLEAVEDSLSCR